jgi:hypothetical protein
MRFCFRILPIPHPGTLIHQSLFSVLLFLLSQTLLETAIEKEKGEGTATNVYELVLFQQQAKA